MCNNLNIFNLNRINKSIARSVLIFPSSIHGRKWHAWRSVLRETRMRINFRYTATADIF